MPAAPPLVSVIVPCYNYGRFLSAAVGSVLAQEEAPSFEVVVVDDGSTDETGAVLDRITDPRVRIVRHPENRGHLRTLETALEACRGALIARLDADDRYLPHFMRSVVPRFHDNPGVGVVWGEVSLIDDSGRVTAARVPGPHAEVFLGSEFLRILSRNVVPVPGMIARRACWMELLPVPDVGFVDDWYFTLNMARRWPFLFLPEVLAEYRVHRANAHASAARSGAEEAAVKRVLDAVFSSAERDPGAEEAKRAVRPRVYAGHARDAGEKYFGFGDVSNARRCYLEALRGHPATVLRQPTLRHFLGTLMGFEAYRLLKRLGGRGGS